MPFTSIIVGKVHLLIDDDNEQKDDEHMKTENRGTGFEPVPLFVGLVNIYLPKIKPF